MKKACLLVTVFCIIGISGCGREKEPAILEQELILEKTNPEASPSRIVCWGDSLTKGSDGTSYPEILEQLSGMEVKNYGVGGETAQCVAVRQGGEPYFVINSVIPAHIESIPITLERENGNTEDILMFGEAGINPCTIEGIRGTLERDQMTGKYYFTREAPGEEINVTKSQLISFGMEDRRDNDILILFSGTNNNPDENTIGEIIDLQKQMLQYANTPYYIIIGMTAKHYMPNIEVVNQKMHEAFGEHFLDVRAYLLESGLADAEITPTDEDLEQIRQGEIPESLRIDKVHGNQAFYKLMAQQVYQKCKDLNYIVD